MVAARHIKLTAIKEYVISRLFRRATGCKYIRLQSLCQVKIEAKKQSLFGGKKTLDKNIIILISSSIFSC